MIKRHVRFAFALIAVAVLGVVTFQPVQVGASEFQVRSVINDPTCLPDPEAGPYYPDYCRTDAAGNRVPSETLDGSPRVERRRIPPDGRVIVTRESFAPDKTYVVVVSGTFDYAFGVADAECTTGGASPVTVKEMGWRAHRWDHTNARDRLDLRVTFPNGASAVAFDTMGPDWIPINPFELTKEGVAAGDAECSQSNEYFAEFTPKTHQGDPSEHLYPQDLRIWVDGEGLTTPRATSALTITVYEKGSPSDAEGNPVGLPFSSARTFKGKSYDCPKVVEDPVRPAPPGATAGEIEHATFFVDPRDNYIEYLQTPFQFWQHAGSFGIYTCNFVFPGSTYEIDVEGTYRYIGGRSATNPAEGGCAQPGDPSWYREQCQNADWWQCSQTPARLPAQDQPDPARTCLYLTPRSDGGEDATHRSVTLRPADADAECAEDPFGGDDLWKFDRVRGGGRPLPEAYDALGRPIGGDYDEDGNPISGPRRGESSRVPGGPSSQPGGAGWFRPDAIGGWHSDTGGYEDAFDLFIGDAQTPTRNWQMRRDRAGNPVRDVWGDPIWDYTYEQWMPEEGTEFPAQPGVNDPRDDAQRNCSRTHEYCIDDWSPEEPGPLFSVIRDFGYREVFNDGYLEVHVMKTGVRYDIPRYQDWCRAPGGWRLGKDEDFDGTCEA